MSLIALFAALALGGCAPSSAPDTGERDLLLMAGRSLAEEYRYAEARIAYEKVLALDSTDAEARFELGNLDARLGRLDEAIRAYEQTIASDPVHDRARHNLAVIHADQGRLPLAVSLLEQMSAYAPALRTLPLFYAKQGRYDLAEEKLLASLQADGENADVQQQLGQLYLRQGRYAQADEALDRSLVLDSTLVETRRLQGLLHLAERRYEKALVAFRQVIDRQPHLIEAHYNLASALSALGREAEALSALERFEKLSGHAGQITRLRRQLDANPDHLPTRLELAHHYRQLGQADAALTHYRAVLLVVPAHLETLIKLSGLLLELGDEREALKLCRRGIARHSADPFVGQLHFFQGYIYMQRKQFHEAKNAFTSALALDSSYAKAWNNLGNAHLALGETDEALPALQAAVEADPQLADAHFNLGGLFLQTRKLARARQAFQAALIADSTFVRAYYALATVYQAQGSITEARDAYRAFIAKWRGDPDFLRQAQTRLEQLTANR